MKLWIANTTRKEFLDECKNYAVYGTDAKFKVKYSLMQKNDYLLIKLKVNSKNRSYTYLGPYVIVDKPHNWAKIETTEGLWFKLKVGNGPAWLEKFSWCVFLSPATEFINSSRVLNKLDDINSLVVEENRILEILNDLVLDEYLPQNKGMGYRTNRGVWVKSRAEYMIDNWFSTNNIVTYYEKPIYLGSKLFYPDWFIPAINIYIEYLGMMDDPSYREKWENKKKYYDSNNLRFVVLIDDDLNNLDLSLINKIPELKINIQSAHGK